MAKKKYKIKRVGSLRGRLPKKREKRGLGHQGVGGGSMAKKKYKIKRVGASKGWWTVDCKKKSAKLRGLGH